MRFKILVPMLQCHDINATKEWHRSVLGFQCVREMEQTECRLESDGAAIMIMKNAHLGVPQATATQYIYVDDVLGLWNSIKHTCATEWGPEEMPYGMLEFAIKDVNGYLLSFGQPIA
jgi:Glyoxalase/Bleomycin resistance protein/Dioxygenase superfamily